MAGVTPRFVATTEQIEPQITFTRFQKDGRDAVWNDSCDLDRGHSGRWLVCNVARAGCNDDRWRCLHSGPFIPLGWIRARTRTLLFLGERSCSLVLGYSWGYHWRRAHADRHTLPVRQDGTIA